MLTCKHALWGAIGLLIAQPLLMPHAHAQQSRQVPAYDKAQTRTVLDRSVFYLPMFGAVYRDKFTALLHRHPGLRGLVIHNHGCGGMWGWETTVAQFYYREGFAVITPEFVTREGNKLGCPGGTPEEMLKRVGKSFDGLRVSVSGSGNVAQYAIEKAMALGAKVVTVSDSNGTVVDEAGFNHEKLVALMHVKNDLRGRLDTYARQFGLALALNLGLDRLLQQGWHQALLFDQDSAIGPDFCRGMRLAWQEAEQLHPGRTAAIGPRLQDPRSGRQVPFRTFDQLLPRPERRLPEKPQLIEAGFLITSGSLLSLQAVRQIGTMKSDYFIDNIDLEWCFRALHHGFKLYGTDHSQLLHRIGEDSDNPLVRSGLMVQHGPLRFYYSSRNRLDLYRRAHAPWRWKVRDLPRFVLKTGALLVFSSQRWAYLKSLLKALRHSRSLS